MKHTKMDVSICIVSLQARDLLRDCLCSIYQTMSTLTFEVIIVDNHSTDGTLEMIKRDFPNVRVLINNQNIGYTRANNQAMHESRGRVIVLINPDTVVNSGAITELFYFLEANPQVGIVGPKVLNRDRTLQKQCRRSEARPWDSFCYFSGLSRIFPKNRLFAGYLMTYLDENQAHATEAISGSCMMIRRQVLEQIGCQDETFFAYQEDTDYCRRARLAGWKVYYDPAAQIIHYGGEGGSRVQPYRSIIEWHRSYYLYYRKHFAGDYPFIFNVIYYLAMAAKLGLSLFLNLFLKKKVVGTRKP